MSPDTSSRGAAPRGRASPQGTHRRREVSPTAKAAGTILASETICRDKLEKSTIETDIFSPCSWFIRGARNSGFGAIHVPRPVAERARDPRPASRVASSACETRTNPRVHGTGHTQRLVRAKVRARLPRYAGTRLGTAPERAAGYRAAEPRGGRSPRPATSSRGNPERSGSVDPTAGRPWRSCGGSPVRRIGGLGRIASPNGRTTERTWHDP